MPTSSPFMRTTSVRRSQFWHRLRSCPADLSVWLTRRRFHSRNSCAPLPEPAQAKIPNSFPCRGRRCTGPFGPPNARHCDCRCGQTPFSAWFDRRHRSRTLKICTISGLSYDPSACRRTSRCAWLLSRPPLPALTVQTTTRSRHELNSQLTWPIGEHHVFAPRE